MNPAETYAALKLLEHALKAAISDASMRAEDYARSVRAKSLETDHGTVTVTRRKPTVTVDEAALLEWAHAHRPDVIVRSINPSDMAEAVDVIAAHHPCLLTTALEPLFVQGKRESLIVDGDDVIDHDTGETVSWATVKPGAEFLTARLSAEAKAAAAVYVAGHVDALVAASLPKELP